MLIGHFLNAFSHVRRYSDVSVALKFCLDDQSKTDFDIGGFDYFVICKINYAVVINIHTQIIIKIEERDASLSTLFCKLK